MKSMHHTVVLDTTLIKNDYTRHGLHLNMSGKERMAALIGKTVKSLLTKQKESSTCIPLPWKENCTNTTTRQNAINSMSNCLPKLNQQKRIPETRILEDQERTEEDLNQQVPSDSPVILPTNTTCTSGRPKRTPRTSDDFLWTANSSRTVKIQK